MDFTMEPKMPLPAEMETKLKMGLMASVKRVGRRVEILFGNRKTTP